MSDVVKVAVIGDPHFISDETKVESGFSHNNIDHPENSSWASLKSHIVQNKLQANLLICVGDMTTQSDKKALEKCWVELCSIALLLKAQVLISTAGNHDVNSVVSEQCIDQSAGFRQMDQWIGLNENLKLLDPPFPIVEFEGDKSIPRRDLRTEYFGDSLTRLDVDGCSVFSFNSCAEHGHHSIERDRGTFPMSSQQNLTHILQKRPLQKVNLFVLHHPIASEPDHCSGAYDYVQNGSLISSCLETEVAPWLILHGHKHFHKISYAQGGKTPPVIFSASSLGVPSVNPEESSNHFYIIELSSDKAILKGKISIWHWFLGKHWSDPETICGFGDSRSASEWACMINGFFEQVGQDELEWERVEDEFRDLSFVLQQDKQGIFTCLDKYHSLILIPPNRTVLCRRSSGV